MITVEKALETILAQIRVLGSERIDILGSRGRVLAEDIVAGLDVPPHDNSSMDGYAVRHTDIADAVADKPVQLKIMPAMLRIPVQSRIMRPVGGEMHRECHHAFL